MFRIYTSSVRSASDGFGRAYATVSERVASQPSWIVRAAAVAALLVFVGVVLLLVIPAVLIGLVVLTVLAAGYALKQRVGRLFHRDARKNVRVITRRE